MATTRRPQFKRLSLNKLIPNVLTVLALCAGLTAIRFGLQDRWELAVACIVLAGILDGLDGRLARLLGGTSRFGAELDSLSDFVNFGVAPALLLFFWSLDQAPGTGWPLALLLAICCGLRLARFNVSLDEDDRPPWATKYFTGVPAPAGAGLAIMPMMLEFEIANGFFQAPLLVGPWTAFVGFLMVSHIPTMSLKSFKVPQRFVLPTLMFVGGQQALADADRVGLPLPC
jgi:CDP-diacylglycerol--serine O-phosphatidyltransferase